MQLKANSVAANAVSATTTNAGSLSGTNASLTGKLTVASLGSDGLFIGGVRQEKCATPAVGAAVTEGTQAALSQGNDKCNQVCPPGSYMVGIRNGKEYDHKHPICRWFNK